MFSRGNARSQMHPERGASDRVAHEPTVPDAIGTRGVTGGSPPGTITERVEGPRNQMHPERTAMPRLICVAPGCEDVAIDGKPHCADHDAASRERLRAARAKAQTGAEAQAGRRLYRDRRWVKASRRFLDRNPLCVDCGELGVVTPAIEVDHKTPHRGDQALFWDQQNWQPLCKSCHSRKTAREVWHRPKGGVGQ